MRKLFERRRRIKRPLSIKLTGLFLLLLPFLQYYGASMALNFPLKFYKIILKSLNSLELFLLFFPFIAGSGLLSVRSWGWYVSALYAAVLTAYNAYLLALKPGIYHLYVFLQAGAGSWLFYYLLRKDISAPYFTRNLRGFRKVRRRNVAIPVSINNREYRTQDVSSRGLYIKTSGEAFAPGQSIRLQFELDNKGYELSAGVVRVDENGIGAAFRNIDSDVEQEIERWLTNGQ